MKEQKYKVVNLENDTEIFFFDHSFKSAKAHAEEYMRRNSHKGLCRLYYRNNTPYGNRWLKC